MSENNVLLIMSVIMIAGSVIGFFCLSHYLFNEGGDPAAAVLLWLILMIVGACVLGPKVGRNKHDRS